MWSLQLSRLIVASFLLLLLCVLAGNAGRPRGRERGRTGPPCPSRQCKCRQKGGDIKVLCHRALGVIPQFAPLNVTYGAVSVTERNITSVPSGAFQHVCARAVELAGNWFDQGGIAEDAFTGLENTVTYMGLAKCGLREIPTASISSLLTLQALRLDGNDIAVVRKKAFIGNIHLKELFLFRNRITTLEKRAFAGPRDLENLKLFENELEQLPNHAFRGLTKLTSIDLSRNRITELRPRTFKGLKKLTWLEVASNRLVSLSPSTFRGLRKLKYLRLDNNPLEVVRDGTFEATRRLAYLSLDIGKVSSLRQPIFGGLSRLLTLNLGEINRESLPAGLFQDMSSLAHLSISDYSAKLRDLSPGVFSNQTDFQKLKIWKAPLSDCRCTEPWIGELAKMGVYIHGYCTHKHPVSCFQQQSKRLPTAENRGKWSRRRKKVWRAV